MRPTTAADEAYLTQLCRIVTETIIVLLQFWLVLDFTPNTTRLPHTCTTTCMEVERTFILAALANLFPP